MKRCLLLATLWLAWPASAQDVPLVKPAKRVCPALLRRIDGWIARLGAPISNQVRKTLHTRLRTSGKTGVARMAAALFPAHAQQQAAQQRTAGQENAREASLLLSRVLDLLQLLGESRSPLAYDVLHRAAQRKNWTNTLRKQALLCLGRLQDPRALGLLSQLLPDQELGYTAGQALLAIEHFAAVTHWIELLASDFQDLKVGAHDALKKWSGERIGPDLRGWRQFFRQYPEGFKKLPGYKSG